MGAPGCGHWGWQPGCHQAYGRRPGGKVGAAGWGPVTGAEASHGLGLRPREPLTPPPLPSPWSSGPLSRVGSPTDHGSERAAEAVGGLCGERPAARLPQRHLDIQQQRQCPAHLHLWGVPWGQQHHQHHFHPPCRQRHACLPRWARPDRASAQLRAPPCRWYGPGSSCHATQASPAPGVHDGRCFLLPPAGCGVCASPGLAQGCGHPQGSSSGGSKGNGHEGHRGDSAADLCPGARTAPRAFTTMTLLVAVRVLLLKVLLFDALLTSILLAVA
nr:pre T-cell antigen receptor alpha isoform X2 [Dromaius novaehollandiae]